MQNATPRRSRKPAYQSPPVRRRPRPVAPTAGPMVTRILELIALISAMLRAHEDRARFIRAAVLALAGLALVAGAARADTYLHRGVETGEEIPYVVQPTGRELATNVDLNMFPIDQIDAVSAALQTSGFRVVRQPFTWASIEPQQGTFTWDETDTIVKSLGDHNLRIVAVLNGSPDWARSPEAPTEPCAGTTGMTSLASMASSNSIVCGRTPEAPCARLASFSAIISRVIATGIGSPTPAACDSTMLR